jgi:hypothetical protein
VARRPPAPPKAHARRGLGDLARAHAAWVRQRWDVGGTHERFEPDGGDFDVGSPDTVPSHAVRALVRRVGSERIAARRRANYRELLRELGERVPRPFRELPEGASPLQLPLEVKEKVRFLERLAAAGVEGADAWPVPHPSVPAGAFPRAEALRESIVGLPVHHELRDSDLEQVARAARG